MGAVLGLAVLAGLLSPRDPIEQDLTSSLFSPSRFHPLGTDSQGRDILARVAHGARVSLTVGALATMAASLIGLAVGLAAGVFGGRTDRILMRGVDLMLAFPTLALLLVLASLFHADNVVALVVLMGLTTWMPVARLARAESLALSRRTFMEAAASLGSGPTRRALRHLIPNVAPTILIAATLQVGDTMLMESGLSYLGLGVAAPTPSWGDMVRQGMPSLGDAWWVATFPGLALAVAVIAFNLVGDGLRDALDPRLAPLTAAGRDPRWAADRPAIS
jgi:peptide/nickel transport system permease protein